MTSSSNLTVWVTSLPDTMSPVSCLTCIILQCAGVTPSIFNIPHFTVDLSFGSTQAVMHPPGSRAAALQQYFCSCIVLQPMSLQGTPSPQHLLCSAQVGTRYSNLILSWDNVTTSYPLPPRSSPHLAASCVAQDKRVWAAQHLAPPRACRRVAR